jgi:hypothetical protein
MKSKKQTPNEQKPKSETKSSLKKEITLILLSIIGTAIFTVITTLYVARYQQPSISIERSFYIAGVRPAKDIPAISKIKITNENLTTIHNLSIPVSKDAYSREPVITVDTFSKYTLEETPFYTTVNIASLPPNKHTIITAFGIYNDLVSTEIGKNTVIKGDVAEADFPDRLVNLPFLGTISADEGVTMKFKQVDMKEFLEQELKDGYVVNRFIGFGIRPVDTEDDGSPDIIDVTLKPGNYYANSPKTFMNEKEFVPGFNSELVVLGAKDQQGKKIPYVQGIDALSFNFPKKVSLSVLYFDIMDFYYPNYHSTLNLRIFSEKENKPHDVTVSSRNGTKR